MSLKHSIASKKRWEGISKEERRRIMSERGRQRWSSMTRQEKKEAIEKMVYARRSKKGETQAKG